MIYYGVNPDGTSLKHAGVPGMKKGVRRYQNPDGSLTPEGYRHYGITPPGQAGSGKAVSKNVDYRQQAKAEAVLGRARRIQMAKDAALQRRITRQDQRQMLRSEKLADRQDQRRIARDLESQRQEAQKQREFERSEAIKDAMAQRKAEYQFEKEIRADERQEALERQANRRERAIEGFKTALGIATASVMPLKTFSSGIAKGFNQVQRILQTGLGERKIAELKQLHALEDIAADRRKEKVNALAKNFRVLKPKKADAGIEKMTSEDAGNTKATEVEASKSKPSSEERKTLSRDLASDPIEDLPDKKTFEKKVETDVSTAKKTSTRPEEAPTRPEEKKVVNKTKPEQKTEAKGSSTQQSLSNTKSDIAKAIDVNPSASINQINKQYEIKPKKDYSANRIMEDLLNRTLNELKPHKASDISDDELYHYGVPNMKKGVRRYQNPDGSLTPEGYRHYGITPRTDFSGMTTEELNKAAALQSKKNQIVDYMTRNISKSASESKEARKNLLTAIKSSGTTLTTFGLKKAKEAADDSKRSFDQKIKTIDDREKELNRLGEASRQAELNRIKETEGSSAAKKYKKQMSIEKETSERMNRMERDAMAAPYEQQRDDAEKYSKMFESGGKGVDDVSKQVDIDKITSVLGKTKKQSDYEIAKEYARKEVEDMSEEEIQQFVNRINAENAYKSAMGIKEKTPKSKTEIASRIISLLPSGLMTGVSIYDLVKNFKDKKAGKAPPSFRPVVSSALATIGVANLGISVKEFIDYMKG